MNRSRITTTIVRLLCGALVILGGSTAVNSGENGEPVFRVLAARQSTPLDWEDEDSVGLINMPRYQPSENVYISGMETPDTILNILEQNRPDLGEEVRDELAQLLEASLIESNLFSSTDALAHVQTKEGPSMPYVFFSSNDGIPVRGEFATVPVRRQERGTMSQALSTMDLPWISMGRFCSLTAVRSPC